MSGLLSQKRMISKLLEAHNKRRAIFSTPELEIDERLSKLAQEHAEYLSKHHILKHANKKHPENDEDLGENLFRINLALADEEEDSVSGEDIAKEWFKEVESYDFEKHQFKAGTGSFTQMVWKSTEKVGFGFSVNDDEHLYVVAFYYPAGNIGNQFKENVMQPIEIEEETPKAGKPEPPKPEPPKPEPPKPEPPKRPETAQEKFIREALEAHNEYRSRHSAPPLTHNPELSEVAQRYAQYLASRNTLKHSDCNWNGKRMGENLAMIMDSRLSCYPGDKATKQWYDEIKYHNFNGEFNSSTGHFTQVVWKSSLQVGFGVAQSSNGSFYAVANYYPAGNMMGSFRQNVSSS